MAMRDEAAPLIKALGLKTAPPLDPHVPVESHLSDDGQILVCVNGLDPAFGVDAIGTQPAAATTLLALREYDPDWVLSAGTAGAFRRNGAAIGDVYLSRCVAYHDRRIALPGFDKYGAGMIETPEAAPIAQRLGLRLANVSTGNSLDLPDQDLKTLLGWGGEVKEMEAAAVAWIARLHGKRFFAVKSITDLMDTGTATEREFLENLHKASARLTETLIHVLSLVTGGMGDVG